MIILIIVFLIIVIVRKQLGIYARQLKQLYICLVSPGYAGCVADEQGALH